jgi:hypothetical protein
MKRPASPKNPAFYEAVLRDVMLLARFKPDLVIPDEAQRIKDFSTKTADAVKSIPRRHAARRPAVRRSESEVQAAGVRGQHGGMSPVQSPACLHWKTKSKESSEKGHIFS